jgi:Homeodomain-containing transcription factor
VRVLFTVVHALELTSLSSSLSSSLFREIKSVTIWFQNRRQKERKATQHQETSRSTVMASQGMLSTSSRPSLESITSRSELRVPSLRMRFCQHSTNATAWDQMPSSPPTSRSSSPQREFIEFGRDQGTRTLEWACAIERAAMKEGRVGRAERQTMLDVGRNTEEPTPTCTLAKGDTKMEAGSRMVWLHRGIFRDDDTMNAVLALCKLRRK